MPAIDLCAKQLISIGPDATLQEAARLMKEHQVGSLVVCEADGEDTPIGFLTDRDIVLYALAEERPLTTSVRDIMTGKVIHVSKDEGIADMVDKMESEGVRRMVVTDEDGAACGVVSADDILQLVAREINCLGRIAQQQSFA